MPKRKNSRAANGTGTIRQRKDGTWECRVTLGKNPATGAQLRKSFYAPTQAELIEKMKDIQADIKNDNYIEPSRLTVGAWVDMWVSEYLGGVKESTQASYRGHVKNHIKPAIGGVKLQQLSPDAVQKFYNGLFRSGLSAKTVKNIHGVLNSAMTQAIDNDYIRKNPCAKRSLPRITKKEVQVMDSDTVTMFLAAIAGHQFEALYFVDLFSGLRQAEILGLTWNAVNFKDGTISIDKQLVKSKIDGRFFLDTPKNDKGRMIKPAPIVMQMLKQRKANQSADQLRAGAAWCNEWNLVFTDETGRHLVHNTVRKHYKRIVAGIGQPDLTFHALRHSYAVLSLLNGDDAKTVQTNLGHHSAAFTLNTYGHTTQEMQAASAQRMQGFIETLNKNSG